MAVDFIFKLVLSDHSHPCPMPPWRQAVKRKDKPVLKTVTQNVKDQQTFVAHQVTGGCVDDEATSLIFVPLLHKLR